MATQKNDQGQDIVHIPLTAGEIPADIKIDAVRKLLVSQGLIDETDIVGEIDVKLGKK